MGAGVGAIAGVTGAIRLAVPGTGIGERPSRILSGDCTALFGTACEFRSLLSIAMDLVHCRVPSVIIMSDMRR